ILHQVHQGGGQAGHDAQEQQDDHDPHGSLQTGTAGTSPNQRDACRPKPGLSQMNAPKFPFRQVTALVLLMALTVVCAMAGQWQLRRGAEREALSAAMQAGSQAPPITLDATTQDGPDWHAARVRGHWLGNFTVLLDNRNLKGQPGLWVATPLRLQDDPRLAILILRGWIPRPLPDRKSTRLNSSHVKI